MQRCFDLVSNCVRPMPRGGNSTRTRFGSRWTRFEQCLPCFARCLHRPTNALGHDPAIPLACDSHGRTGSSTSISTVSGFIAIVDQLEGRTRNRTDVGGIKLVTLHRNRGSFTEAAIGLNISVVAWVLARPNRRMIFAEVNPCQSAAAVSHRGHKPLGRWCHSLVGGGDRIRPNHSSSMSFPRPEIEFSSFVVLQKRIENHSERGLEVLACLVGPSVVCKPR